MRRFLGIMLVFAAFLSITSAALPHLLLAQSTSSLTEQQIAERQAILQAELDRVMKEIDEQKAILGEKQKQGVSLERDIAILNAKIKEAQLKIRAKEISIQQLGKDINTKTERIQLLGEKAEQGKDSLSQLLRKTRYLDDFSIFEIMMSNKDLSEFLLDLDSYFFVKNSLNQSLDVVKKVKADTEVERSTLNNKRAREIDAKVSIVDEQNVIKSSEKEKQRLLGLSKKEQQTYKSVINEKEAKAAAIRSALFALRDTSSIPFGEALKYANNASYVTGVRPAFILGILTQESNLGQNVGSCYVTNLQTGESKGVNTGRVFANGIHPTRDLPILATLLAELGRDPLKTKVSCPQSIGYGGAMGPAQFIPSTWSTMKSSISTALGKSVPDPWLAQDVIMASALFLRDLGAGAGTVSAEKNAACKYYSGRSCASSAEGNSYGTQVMAKTENIQLNMINLLQN